MAKPEDVSMSEYVTYNDGALEETSPQIFYKNIFFWITFGSSCILAFCLYLAGYLFAAVSCIGLTLAVAMFIAPQLAFYVYFAWQSLDPIFISGKNIITPGKVLSLVIILVYIVSFFSSRKQILVSKSVIVIMLLFGLFGLLGSPFALSPLIALRYSLQVMIHIVLIIAALQLLYNENFVYSAFLWCFIGGVFAGIIMLITGGISSQFGRGTLGEFANPNTTAFAFSVSLMSLAGLWCFKRPKLYYVIYLLGGAIIFIGMMKTGSRASLIAIFFALSLGIMLSRRIKITKRIFMPILLSLVLGFGVLSVLKFGLLDEKSQVRLELLLSSVGMKHDISGGRLDIWEKVLSTYLEKRPVLGFGFGNSNIAMQIYRGKEKDIHSSLFGPLCDSGPIGFILFVCGLFLLYLRIRVIDNSRMNLATTMIFVFLIVSSIAHTIHFTKWFWIPVTMCLLLAELSRREKLEEPGESVQKAVILVRE